MRLLYIDNLYWIYAEKVDKGIALDTYTEPLTALAAMKREIDRQGKRED